MTKDNKIFSLPFLLLVVIAAILFAGVVKFPSEIEILGCSIQIISFILGSAFVFTAGVGAISYCWRGHWLIPSIVVCIVAIIIILFCYFLSYQYLLRGGHIEDSGVQNLLTTTTIILTIFAVAVAFLALFFGKKIEAVLDLGHSIKDLAQMTVTSAELAFSILPDFTESHQIPTKQREVLERICQPVFEPGSPTLEYLKETGNQATLRYVKGLKLFAEDDYVGAIDIFEDVLNKKSKARYNIKNAARYRLGITYRQEKRYRESVECFRDQYTNAQGKRERVQAKYGAALTLYAICQNAERYWTQHKQKRKKTEDALGEISPALAGGLSEEINTVERCAFELIKEVVNTQPSNYSAILYLAKFYLYHSEWFQSNSLNSERLEEQVMALLRFLEKFPESLNIKANYLMVETICYLCLRKIKECGDFERKAKIALKYAWDSAQEYKNTVRLSATIFSDEQVKQIPVDEFIEEIKSVDAEYSLGMFSEERENGS